jgi:hypothetical protein
VSLIFLDLEQLLRGNADDFLRVHRAISCRTRSIPVRGLPAVEFVTTMSLGLDQRFRDNRGDAACKLTSAALNELRSSWWAVKADTVVCSESAAQLPKFRCIVLGRGALIRHRDALQEASPFFAATLGNVSSLLPLIIFQLHQSTSVSIVFASEAFVSDEHCSS